MQALAPKLDPRSLWLSLLLPGILTGLCMLILIATKGREESVMNIGMFVVGITTIATWVQFSRCISKRYVGTSRVLLILAYPVMQVVLVFTTFFAGCLVLVSTEGLH